MLVCSSVIPQAAWSVHENLFHSDLKVLDIPAYDTILGLDWLESFSPMKVHGQQRWMAIPYQNSTAVLYGTLPELPEGAVVQVCTVQITASDSMTVSLPQEVQALIEEFAVLFAVPTELPPPRSCDHTIPLVAGAARVSVTPYRYAPKFKDEIEAQVKEMLKVG
jgi:hypothetical protein